MNTLKDTRTGDVVIIVAKVVKQNGGQTLVEYGDGKQWSMVDSIGAQIIRPNVDVQVIE